MCEDCELLDVFELDFNSMFSESDDNSEEQEVLIQIPLEEK